MSEPELWIVVRNWERFQHYDPAKRTPPWIKNYLELLDDDAYRRLSSARRAVLHAIWMGYAKSRQRLPVDTSDLSQRFALRITKPTLEALRDAGFIEFSASAPLALARTRARAQTETETEVEAERLRVQGDLRAELLPVTQQLEEHPLAVKLLASVRGLDNGGQERLETVLTHYAGRLPEGCFARALEALEHRRGEDPPLESEAGYVVATLSTMQKEREP